MAASLAPAPVGGPADAGVEPAAPYFFARSTARSSCALFMLERPSIFRRFAWA